MNSTQIPTSIPAKDLKDLEAAVADMIRGARDPALMEEASRELEAGREEIRRRLGETQLAEILTDRDDP